MINIFNSIYPGIGKDVSAEAVGDYLFNGTDTGAKFNDFPLEIVSKIS